MERHTTNPTTLFFTFSEMVEALERIGYVIKEESITEQVHRGTYFEDKTYKLFNVYLDDKLMAEWAGYYTSRVQWVFKEELQKRMLGLFR